jgi:putative DNA primase/helicase
MHAEELADALTCGDPSCRCRRPNRTGWLVHCPAHRDERPSLSIRDGEDTILIHCFAGCSQEAVIEALKAQGLWPKRGAAAGRPTTYHDEPVLCWYDYRGLDGSPAYSVGRTPSKQFPVIRPDGAGRWIWGLGDHPWILYRLPELATADPATWVFVVEGEKDADRLAELGLVATTNPFGAGKWRFVSREPLRGRPVAVIPDNDEAGRRHAREVARSLSGVAREVVLLTGLPGVGPGGDISDFLDAGHGPQDLWTLVRQGENYQPPPAHEENASPGNGGGGPGPVLVRLSDVTPEQVAWLWKGRLPIGKMVIVEGDPDTGKSWLTLAIAAAVTTGAVLPGGEGREPADVLILTAEDGLADTVRPRLDEMGADVSRVIALPAVRDAAGAEQHPSLVRDLPHFEAVLAGGGFKLVIIDPLNAYLGTDLDTHRDAAIRSVLTPLAHLAEKYGVTIVCIRHLTKANQKAIYRGGGSIAYTAAARVVLLVGEHPDDKRLRVLAPVKNNLAPFPPSLTFQISEDGRFVWRGETSITADELQGPEMGDEGRAALDEAVAFLRETLADGPVKAKTVQREASEAGMSESTLKRAKAVLGVQTLRQQQGFGGENGYWVWELPSKVRRESPTLQGDQAAPLGDGGSETTPDDAKPGPVVDGHLDEDGIPICPECGNPIPPGRDSCLRCWLQGQEPIEF